MPEATKAATAALIPKPTKAPRATLAYIKREWPVEKQQAHAEVFSYLNALAARAAVDISGWDIMKAFADERGELPDANTTAGKRALNKAFFAKPSVPDEAEELVRPIEAPPFILPESFIKVLAEMADRGVIDARRSYEQQMQHTAEQLVNLERQTKAQFAEYRKYRLLIDALPPPSNKPSDKRLEMFKSIANDGLWVDPRWDSATGFWLRTSKPAILRERNKAQNVDITVNFGYLALQWKPMTMELFVFPHRECIRRSPQNTNVKDYFHPHVAPSGMVCFGTAQYLAANALMAGDFEKVLSYLTAVLFNYHNDNPHMSMAVFSGNAGVTIGPVNYRLYPQSPYGYPDATPADKARKEVAQNPDEDYEPTF